MKKVLAVTFIVSAALYVYAATALASTEGHHAHLSVHSVIKNQAANVVAGTREDNDIVLEKAVEIGGEKFTALGTTINSLVDRMQDLGYDISRAYIYSPGTADRKVQEMEQLLDISPEFRQRLRMKAGNARIKQHKMLRKNGQREAQVDSEGGGETGDLDDAAEADAKKFIKEEEAAEGGEDALDLQNPTEEINAEINSLEDIADQAVSLATGTDDYTGYEASKAQDREKAETELLNSMGLGAVKLSYDTPQQVAVTQTSASATVPGSTAAPLAATEREAGSAETSESLAPSGSGAGGTLSATELETTAGGEVSTA